MPSIENVHLVYRPELKGRRRPTHALTTNDVSQPAEEELTDNVADRSGDLDTEILVRREGTGPVLIDITQHGGGDVDCENIVAAVYQRGCGRADRAGEDSRIGEETDTSDETHFEVEPARSS